MLTWLFACADGGGKDTGPAEGIFSFTADDYVSLPFATEGDPAPEGTLTLTASGGVPSEGRVSIDVTGSFAVDGDTSALRADEAREFTARYTGDTSEPVIETGTITVTVDGEAVDVGVAAVLGDVELPDATWIADGWGDETTVALPSAPYPYGDSEWDDPSVLVFVPDGIADRGALGLVTHLHGHDATLSEVVTAQRLREQVALSGRDAVLIAPQGPEEAASGDFGRLMEPGGYANLVRDVLSLLYRDGYIARPVAGEVTLTAHSGGYLATAAILEGGGVPIAAVHLFDALYGESDTFADFAEADGVLRSTYTATGGTTDENVALRATLENAGLTVSTTFQPDDLADTSVSIGASDSTHSGCVIDEQSYARWLAASGLPHRPAWPPELLSVVSDGTRATVSWVGDLGGDGLRYRVEGSDDGARWSFLTDTADTTATVDASPWLRLRTTDARYGNSEPSDTYGGTGADWLVVDGFDRTLDGSYDHPTHTFAADLGHALGTGFSVASNEAIASGRVSLSDYPRVLWMLGDEGLVDRTFSEEERDAVEAYVDAGGVIVVSGSEVGYATDPDWLSSVLHAELVADDAGTTSVEGWTVGAAYTEDYPDVLAGDTTIWEWATGGAAAVGWNRQVVVVGFGLENLSEEQREAAVGELVEWVQ